MLLSVIIPVYNVKNEIECLLNGLLEQDLNEVEIILVDDGSIDGSDFVCSKYSERNSNIKVLYQKNRGCYAARQTALECATGKYITFIDSDDIVDNTYTSTIKKAIKKNGEFDIYVFGYKQQYPKECLIFNNKNKEYNAKEYYQDILLNVIQGPFALWNHVYSKDFLKKNGISFNTKYRKAGDAVFNDLCIMANPTIFTSKENVYIWKCGHESLTTKFEPTMWITILEHEKNLEEMYKEFCDTIDLRKELSKKRWYYFNYLFNNIRESNLKVKDKRDNYNIILKKNLNKEDIKYNLGGLRYWMVYHAYQYNNPIFLYLWYYTYLDSWRVKLVKLLKKVIKK